MAGRPCGAKQLRSPNLQNKLTRRSQPLDGVLLSARTKRLCAVQQRVTSTARSRLRDGLGEGDGAWGETAHPLQCQRDNVVAGATFSSRVRRYIVRTTAGPPWGALCSQRYIRSEGLICKGIG